MLTVVIPTHNRNDLLRRTLLSLAACERPAEYARTIVIENGGRHGAEQVCREAADWLNVEYMYHEQGNKSAALNAVLEHVGDDLLFFLDDDVRLDVGVLTAYADAGRNYDTAFFGGPVQVDYEMPPLPWVKLPPSARGWSMAEGTSEIQGSDFLGCNWAARAADLRKCGGFDPQFGPGGTTGGRGQETDMQQRLLKAGWRTVYVSDAPVWHYVPKECCSPKWSLRRGYQQAVSHGHSEKCEATTIFGYPRWTIAEAARRFAAASLATVTGGRRVRYLAWYQYYLCRGFMEGQRHALRRQRELHNARSQPVVQVEDCSK